MKCSLHILNLIVVIFVTKLKADPYEPYQGLNLPVQEPTKHQNVLSFFKYLPKTKSEKETEPELHTERSQETLDTNGDMDDVALSGGSTIMSKILKKKKYSKKSRKTPPRCKRTDHYREIGNIFGLQFEDVGVLSNKCKIETEDNTSEQIININDQEHFPTQKHDTAPMHGPDMSLDNEDEDKDKDEDVPYPPWYHQPHGRKQEQNSSYISPNMNSLSKLLYDLAAPKSSEFSSSKQPMTSNKKYQHHKDSTSKIVLDRQNIAWPFGYDLTKTPVKYSILHKIAVQDPYQYVIGTRKNLKSEEDKKEGDT